MTSPPVPAPAAAVLPVGGQSLLGSGLDGARFIAADALHGLLFGRHLPPPMPTGSGDTRFDWTSVLLVFLLALAGGGLWTFLQRRGPSAAHLRGLESGLRGVLVLWLTAYGLAKFSFGQFGLLEPGQLVTTYGESSPMGLLWRFMAASPGYQYLAGAAELLPALLLLHRRTVTLGALIACVTLVNVLALNIFYDVPVKLFSGHLLLAALVLLALDGSRLWAFMTGRAFAASAVRPASPRWEVPTAWALSALLLGAALFSTLIAVAREAEGLLWPERSEYP